MKQIEVTPSPPPRSGHRSVVFGKSMFIVGGGVTNDLEVYGFDFGNIWSLF